MEENIDISVNKTLHCIDYIIHMKTINNRLKVEVEDKGSGEYWRNEFSQHYIEEITQKTGNYKKFNVFVKMMMDGMQNRSEYILLDILTLQDLQNMKSKQNNEYKPMMTSSDRRYLILTYMVEYDKIHYPLPLILDIKPDLEYLKNTIKQQRQEINELKKKTETKMGISQNQFYIPSNNDTQLYELQKENEKLKYLLDQGQQKQQFGALENDNLIRDKIHFEEDTKNKEIQYQTEIQRLEYEIEQKDKIIDRRNQLNHSNLQMQDLMVEKEKDESQIITLTRQINRWKKDHEQLQIQYQNSIMVNKKQSQQIKQLEKDLELAINNRRGNNVTERLYNRNGGTPSVRSGVSGNRVKQNSNQYNSRQNSNYQKNNFIQKNKVIVGNRSGSVTSKAVPYISLYQNTIRSMDHRTRGNSQQNKIITQGGGYKYQNRAPSSMSVGSNRTRNSSIDSKRSNRNNDIINRNIKAITDKRNPSNRVDNKIRRPSPLNDNYNKRPSPVNSYNKRPSPVNSYNKRPSPVSNNYNRRPSPVNNYNNRPSPVNNRQQPINNYNKNNRVKYSPNNSQSQKQKNNPYVVNNTKYVNNQQKDDNLMNKLQDLKNRNRSGNKQEQQNIDDRLNRLQDLLRMAKS